MPEGPIAVNVFARLHDADAFFSVCRRMRLEGAKRLEIASAQAARGRQRSGGHFTNTRLSEPAAPRGMKLRS
jgi:hypothetical protein